jgi:predicted thioesterase
MTSALDQRRVKRAPPTRGRLLRVAVGECHQRSFTVTRERCISNLVEDLPSIMGTYALVEWMEIAAALCIGDFLDQDQLSVAESIDIQHFKAVGEGAQVLGSRVWFDIRAHVDGIKVGECIHVRAVVPRRLLERVVERVAAGAMAASRLPPNSLADRPPD